MIYIQFSRFLEKRRFTPKGFDPYIIHHQIKRPILHFFWCGIGLLFFRLSLNLLHLYNLWQLTFVPVNMKDTNPTLGVLFIQSKLILSTPLKATYINYVS